MFKAIIKLVYRKLRRHNYLQDIREEGKDGYWSKFFKRPWVEMWFLE